MERIKLIIEHNLECNLNFSFALDRSVLIEKLTNYLKYQYRLQCLGKKDILSMSNCFIFILSPVSDFFAQTSLAINLWQLHLLGRLEHKFYPKSK